MTPPPAWLNPVLAATLEAGALIRDLYRRQQARRLTVERKADHSPVTEADLAAHRVLDAALAPLLPGVPVVSEENADSHPLRVSSERFWLIDPLDGTREFIEKRDEFTVNVALIDAGRPVFGTVYAPIPDELFWGGRDIGAWQRIDGRDRPLHSLPLPVRLADGRFEAAMRIVASRSHLNDATRQWINAHRPHLLLQSGSSLKFCRIAQGYADCYPRMSPTAEWDTAAAQAIVEAAGGQVIDDQGRALRYGKPDVLNPSFLVTGPAATDGSTLSLQTPTA
ncbi:MAG: 3'(2'),5'-bisphosphate nucleotidase CysQ [Burkholderiaceae bacterium]